MTSGAQFDDQAMGAPPAAGDAGTNYLATLLDAPVDGAEAKQVSEGGQRLKALAAGGGFTVSEAVYEQLIAVCDAFLSGYPAQKRKIDVLAKHVDMGSSQYASKVADFNVTVANGDPQSLLPNLDLMRTGIEQAKEALEIARKNYHAAEDAHTDALHAIHRTGE